MMKEDAFDVLLAAVQDAAKDAKPDDYQMCQLISAIGSGNWPSPASERPEQLVFPAQICGMLGFSDACDAIMRTYCKLRDE